MTKILLLSAFVVVGAAGLAAGLALRPAPLPPKTIEIHESSQTLAPLDHAQLASLIRGVVREEVNRIQPHSVAAEGVKEPPRAERTAEQVEACDRGQSLVAAAQQRGRWTAEDRDQFRAVMLQLSATDREELLHTLIPAINRQEVKVDTLGPAF